MYGFANLEINLLQASFEVVSILNLTRNEGWTMMTTNEKEFRLYSFTTQ